MSSNANGELLKVRTERSGCCATMWLTGHLDLSTVEIFDLPVRRLVARDRPEHLLIDVSGLSFVDSSGLGSLFKAVQKFDGNVGIIGHSSVLNDRLNLVRFWEDFWTFQNLEEAQSHFHTAA